jgi:hypothetical protein
MHLGSGIKKNSVSLNIYLTGNVLDSATDKRANGVLYNQADDAIGFVLYNEGFIIINNTDEIIQNYDSNFSASQDGSTVSSKPRWIYFGTKDVDTINNYSSSVLFYDVDYSIKENIPTLTTFIPADKNSFNHSNNITYLQSGSFDYTYNSGSFSENQTINVKNVVKSPFISGSGEFEKETYISKIGLYDKEKNLIGYASLATPIRKTENREFLFKLKLDI